MKRYELWVDNNNRLVVSEFGNFGDRNESKIFKGRNTYEVIRKIASKSLIGVYDDTKNRKIVLEYKNYIVNINDAEKVMDKRGIGPLNDSIRLYEEGLALRRIKKKKVTRKNKHSGRKIIATGLILLILASSANLLKDNIKAYTLDNLPFLDNSVEEIVNDIPQVVNMSFNKDNGYIEENDSIEDVKIENINIDYKESDKVSIDYGDRSNTDKAYNTKAYYGHIIGKYAKRYGMDPNLVIGIATQERGIHGTTVDPGGAIGLMQVQYNVWANEKVSAYNFETREIETFTIDPKRLSDLDYNIRIGCMIFQNTMRYMNYNTVAAVQCYNMGYGSMQKILKAYSCDCGKTVDEILSDPTDNGWLPYRDMIKAGDQRYVEHVFSWMGENIDVSTQKKDGSIVNLNINNEVPSRKIY